MDQAKSQHAALPYRPPPRVHSRRSGPYRRHGGVVLAALMLAACQQARYIEEGPPVLDLYEAMSADDVAMAEAAMQTTLETAADNASVDWRNPETGNGGRFTPIRTYQTQGGYFCRTFDEELTVDGRTVTYADNHACRSEQGVWLFQDD